MGLGGGAEADLTCSNGIYRLGGRAANSEFPSHDGGQREDQTRVKTH
jgi:hypothetical protein